MRPLGIVVMWPEEMEGYWVHAMNREKPTLEAKGKKTTA